VMLGLLFSTPLFLAKRDFVTPFRSASFFSLITKY
jgi:hypothetical protein